MSEFNNLNIIIIIALSYTVWIVFLFVMMYKFGLIGLIFGIILPPIFGFLNFPVQTATTLVSFTYLAIIIYVMLRLYILYFNKNYPPQIKNIPLKMIALSKENMDSYIQSLNTLEKLSKLLQDIKSLDISKRQDGFYNERSHDGKEANKHWQNLKNSIRAVKRELEDITEKQIEYLYKWTDIQEIRNYAHSLFISFIGAIFILLISNLFYRPLFIVLIQRFIIKNSQIKLLYFLNNSYSSMFELSGLITIFFLPIAIIIVNYFKSPYKKEYGQLKKLLEDLNKNKISCPNDDNITSIEHSTSYDFDRVKKLIDSGEDINKVDSSNNFSELHYASMKGKKEVVEFLIEHGANIDLQGYKKWTPLYRAIVDNQPKIAMLLIEKGANVNLKDSDGWIPLHRAIKDNHLDIAKKLIEHGADINAQNNIGWTPLHRAIADNHFDFTKYLMSKGANINLQNNAGQSPLDLQHKNMFNYKFKMKINWAAAKVLILVGTAIGYIAINDISDNNSSKQKYQIISAEINKKAQSTDANNKNLGENLVNNIIKNSLDQYQTTKGFNFDLAANNINNDLEHGIVGFYDTPIKNQKIAIAYTKPQKEYDCHACAPAISFFIFEINNNNWLLKKSYINAMENGQWGMPDAKDAYNIVDLGSNLYGLMIKYGGVNQGFIEEDVAIYTFNEQKIERVFDEMIGADDSGARETSQNSWQATISFDKSSDPYNIILHKHGIENSKKIDEQILYSYSAQKHEYTKKLKI